MKRALALVVLVGCGASVPARRDDSTTVEPSFQVLRDIRKDAAFYLHCQTPAVDVEVATWQGSQGNIVAFGCGFQITYYVVCQASNQCGFVVAE